MATKVNLPWVESVGEIAISYLSAHYGRPFSFHQGGPYAQGKHPMVGIHLNEPQFRVIPVSVSSDIYDDRFGFEIQHVFDKRADQWLLFAGFSLRNKVVVRNAFVPSFSDDYKRIGISLAQWAAVAAEEGVALNFDQLGGGKYIYKLEDSAQTVVDALSKYPDLERRSSGKHKDKPAPMNGANFMALQAMPKFDGLHEGQSLLDHADQVAHSACSIFDQLYFLYELLLPRNQPIPIESSPVESVLKLHEEPPTSIDLVDPVDERKWIHASVVQRQGQGDFRKNLLRAYKGRCAISGTDVQGTLQAAHIRPYSGPNANHCSNGLLLRADLHNLFDLGLLKIDPDTLTVKLSPDLKASHYSDLDGASITTPAAPSDRPSKVAMKHRFELD